MSLEQLLLALVLMLAASLALRGVTALARAWRFVSEVRRARRIRRRLFGAR
jgi:hypothetical protein